MCGNALADFNSNFNDRFQRFDPTAPSNSGHTVINECDGAFDGNGFPGQRPAQAWLKTFQSGDMTEVKIVLRNGRPNTLYTVWLRLKGNDQEGNSFGGSPLSNGGATPMAAGFDIDQLVADWIGTGNQNPVNGFWTNDFGQGTLIKRLDFPLIGGTYPFNKISTPMLAAIRASKNNAALATPTAIVDPRDNGVSGPFLLRIVSHCQDNQSHGLSPANRETWFDFP
jgi:hypothetical protein